jgi:excisionase family DNA binding protein
MSLFDMKISDLLDEIEERFRRSLREEIKNALIEANNPSFKIDEKSIQVIKNNEIKKEFPTILTASEVAVILGVSVQRVYELVRAGKATGIPVIKLGDRQYRFSKEAIVQWLNKDS